MREILEACVRVDELAGASYRDMQRRCTDATVAELCGVMAEEDATHVAWWQELLDAWDTGELPDVWSPSDAALPTLTDAIAELETLQHADDGPIDRETTLTTAARIEFFALDPVFAEILELAEPGIGRARHDAYARHVDRLVEALEKTFPRGSLPHFLARTLRRAVRENGALTHYATTDVLTGLGNRRALATQAGQWASWAARYGCAVTYLLIDIDDFKRVNGLWGHLVGDRVLAAVGRTLRSTVRGADMVTRYGADEFVILAPELEPDGAEVLAARLVDAVGALAIEAGPDATLSVTISVGIATAFDPPDSPARPLDELLAAADRSMHEARSGGKGGIGAPVVLLRAKPLE